MVICDTLCDPQIMLNSISLPGSEPTFDPFHTAVPVLEKSSSIPSSQSYPELSVDYLNQSLSSLHFFSFSFHNANSPFLY